MSAATFPFPSLPFPSFPPSGCVEKPAKALSLLWAPKFDQWSPERQNMGPSADGRAPRSMAWGERGRGGLRHTCHTWKSQNREIFKGRVGLGLSFPIKCQDSAATLRRFGAVYRTCTFFYLIVKGAEEYRFKPGMCVLMTGVWHFRKYASC